MSEEVTKQRAERCVTHSYACDCREYRSQQIKRAAIDLVKRLYYSDERIFYDWSEVSEVMDAVGVTVDDLAEVTE